MDRSEPRASISSARAAEVAKQAAAAAREILGNGVRILWFGSWPEGRAVRGSDIDLALDAETPISPVDLARVREAIDDLRTLYSVDLVDLAHVDERLRRDVLARGIAL